MKIINDYIYNTDKKVKQCYLSAIVAILLGIVLWGITQMIKLWLN
ncbi:hypothetical protein [Lactiplantibacillus plantarum]|nr:hypothetical protein [Lactiplantibacillus plantarum]